ncbi:uncharacterized protein LOC129220732 [Uloborus diversus]|uniref:uncharacterized protein LOC129220732 n=1 Tax=Uloborus diversus TaxID=327109 RepID=UPI0024090DAC|nr:uncharacterized protein LOC129220732 [Uloborus diversus]
MDSETYTQYTLRVEAAVNMYINSRKVNNLDQLKQLLIADKKEQADVLEVETEKLAATSEEEAQKEQALEAPEKGKTVRGEVDGADYQGDLSPQEKFLRLQRKSDSLLQEWLLASQGKGGYFVLDNLLFHKEKVGGIEVTQLVLPLEKRLEVMKRAHETPFGGHMAAKKTCDRVRRKKQSKFLLTSNAKGEEVPVVVCRGWFDTCEYCDKRFCNWLPVDEEVYEKIPLKPGVCMVALKSKGITEVVSIILDHTDIQLQSTQTIDIIKEQLSNRKSKASKSEIIVRWFCSKRIDDKEVIALCAHWFNNAVLPRFLEQWPGANLLETSNFLVFSKNLQKWCHPTKDPVWKKSKELHKKTVEVIKKCDWRAPCDICDRTFRKWTPFSKVYSDNLIPECFGIYMLSAVSGQDREVVRIDFFTKASIQIQLNSLQQYVKCNIFRCGPLRNTTAEIRWTTLKDDKSDEACHLYAHWLNVGEFPRNNSAFPVETLLAKNHNFVVRARDKKWCTITSSLRSSKPTKMKEKKALVNAMEYLYDDV